MTEKELEIFRKLDDKLYSVNRNNTYKHFFRNMDKNINLESVQDFINKLASWYFVKYSNKYVKLYLAEEYDKIDYSQEKLMTFDKLILRLNELISTKNKNALLYYKQLIIMAGWKLVYYNNSIPEYGYFRAQKMFEDFNKEFDLNLNMHVYESVMNTDYSENNPEIIKLLEQKKEKELKPKNISKIRKLFRR